jgi:hypothetical protein
MTIGSLLFGTLVSQILFVLIKIAFIGSLDLDSWLVWVIFFGALAIAAIATVRRMGVLNYIESFFLVSFWFITSLVVDYVITTKFIGYDIYKTWSYWLTHLVIIVIVILFHKKLHVEVRKAGANK